MNKRQRLSNWILVKDNSMFLVDINKNERSVKIWLNTHTHTHTYSTYTYSKHKKRGKDVLDEKPHQTE